MIMPFPPLTGFAGARPGLRLCLIFAWPGRLDRPADRFDLIGSEIEEPAMTTLQLRGRIVFRAHRHVNLAVDVVQHRLNGCLPADKEEVLGIRTPRARTHPHPAAARDPDASD